MNRYSIISVLFGATLMTSAAVAVPAAGSGHVTAAKSDVREAPFADAKVIARLAAKTPVTLAERKGAWVKISAGNGTSGWLKLHQVRAAGGRSASESGAKTAGMLWNVGTTGRSGAKGIDATTGIRGLSAEELRTAKPDPAAVRRLDGFAASDSAAREHAQAGALHEQDVPEIKGE